MKEALDEMALRIENRIERASAFAVDFGWNDGDAALVVEAGEQLVAVVAAVCDEVRVRYVRREGERERVVVALPLGELELDGMAEGVHTSVNLCSESSARGADALRSVFFRAPAES